MFSRTGIVGAFFILMACSSLGFAREILAIDDSCTISILNLSVQEQLDLLASFNDAISQCKAEMTGGVPDIPSPPISTGVIMALAINAVAIQVCDTTVKYDIERQHHEEFNKMLGCYDDC